MWTWQVPCVDVVDRGENGGWANATFDLYEDDRHIARIAGGGWIYTRPRPELPGSEAEIERYGYAFEPYPPLDLAEHSEVYDMVAVARFLRDRLAGSEDSHVRAAVNQVLSRADCRSEAGGQYTFHSGKWYKLGKPQSDWWWAMLEPLHEAALDDVGDLVHERIEGFLFGEED